MKRRDLLCQLPAWLAAPGFVRAQSGPKLLVVLTSFAKANVAARARPARGRNWRAWVGAWATTCGWSSATATTGPNGWTNSRANWWRCSRRRR